MLPEKESIAHPTAGPRDANMVADMSHSGEAAEVLQTRKFSLF